MDLDYERPRTRGDCQGGERPCPWVGCTHHLIWVRLYKADLGSDERILRVLERMPETCALDVADRGGANLRTIGDALNLTHERVRQIEARVLAPESLPPRVRGRLLIVRQRHLRAMAAEVLPEGTDRRTQLHILEES